MTRVPESAHTGTNSEFWLGLRALHRIRGLCVPPIAFERSGMQAEAHAACRVLVSSPETVEVGHLI